MDPTRRSVLGPALTVAPSWPARALPGGLRRLLLRLFPRWGLRRNDVLLASFPKSGNTWVRFLWANVVAQEELDGRKVDFHVLDREFGSEYESLSYGTVTSDRLPRLVKTHRRYDARAFGPNRSVYLHRHPGDVMLSYFDYLRARPGHEGSPAELPAFLRSEDVGVPAWCRHVRSWIEEATVLLGYGELKRDAADALGRVLSGLGVGEVAEATLREAARRSSFERLRELEEARGRPRDDEFHPGYRFMRKGRHGSWRERLDPADAGYLVETVRSAGLETFLDPPGDDAPV